MPMFGCLLQTLTILGFSTQFLNKLMTLRPAVMKDPALFCVLMTKPPAVTLSVENACTQDSTSTQVGKDT